MGGLYASRHPAFMRLQRYIYADELETIQGREIRAEARTEAGIKNYLSKRI